MISISRSTALRASGRAVLLLVGVLILLASASSASAVTFGMMWTGSYGQASDEMEQVQRSGATVFRVPIDRSRTADGTDWSTYDPIFESALSHGITIEPILLRSNASGKTEFPT